MAETDHAHARARSLISKHLGIEHVQRVGDAYRDPAGELLEGEWLGAFVQPGVLLNRVSAMSVHLGSGTSQIVDEYGRSTVLLEASEGRRVRWLKKYAPKAMDRIAGPAAESLRHFHYVGELRDGALAGYWYSAYRPQFRGLFWLERVDRMAPETAECLRSRVSSWSPRRLLVTMLAVVVPIAVVAIAAFGTRDDSPSGSTAAWGALAVIGALAATHAVLKLRSTRALRAEVAVWERALG